MSDTQPSEGISDEPGEHLCDVWNRSIMWVAACSCGWEHPEFFKMDDHAGAVKAWEHHEYVSGVVEGRYF